MGGIREFRRDDVAAVADLWLRAYRGREDPAPESLRRYFDHIYFGNPWVDPTRPSYVHEDEAGRIAGFVALFPRPMRFDGRPVHAAVLSTIMVDPRERGRSIGRRLMEAAFQAPHDLIFTDGANESCRKLWRAAGGDLCLVYSCNWIRTLRPGAALLDRAASRPGLRAVTRVLRPAAWLGDAALGRVPASPYRLPVPPSSGEEVTADGILHCLSRSDRPGALVPEYEDEALPWLLHEAAQATRRGRLRQVVVRDAAGTTLGWYVYFAQAGGLCWVMQIGGAPQRIREVLLQLFDDARRHGAVELRGQLEPHHVAALSELRCQFSFDDLGFLVHTRDGEIRRAVHAGDTALSRLDGEWWMHFADGPWT